MALLDNLISYWKLDEASGNALDAHGSHTLTENGTIASTTGKIGNARVCEVTSNERFSCASDGDLQTGDIDWSIAGWVNPALIDFYRVIASKDAIGSAREWILLIDADFSSKFSFNVFDGTTTSRGVARWATPPSASTWYFIAAGHNASLNEVWISVDAGTPVTDATSGAPGTNATDFCLGGHGSHNIHWDGAIDEFGFWKRDIRSDLATLYNGGAGLSYDDFGGGGFVPFPRPRGMRAGMTNLGGGMH